MSKKITGETKGQITTKSGKGNSHGVVSEVSAYLTVKPGHEEEARAASLRFGELLKKSKWEDIQKTGLRDARLVIFDNGHRLMFASGFETDWDPYVDDAILVVGIQHFLDWMQHTEEAEELVASVKSLVKDLDKNDPALFLKYHDDILYYETTLTNLTNIVANQKLSSDSLMQLIKTNYHIDD